MKLIQGTGKYKQNAFHCHCTLKAGGKWPSKTAHTLETHDFDNGCEESPIQFKYQVYKCTTCGHELQTPEMAEEFEENYSAQRQALEEWML